MKRFIAMALLALPLAACTPALEQAGSAPAPLERTTADDIGLETTWRAFDAALDALNVLGDVGVIKPGSPAGKAVAAGVRKVTSALQAAERFAAAGSTASYRQALEEARAGLADIRAAINGKK